MFDIEVRGSWVVVHPAGELDLAVADQFRIGLVEALNRRRGARVAVDFSDVTFLDCSAISALIMALRQTQTRGGRLVLVGVGQRIGKVLEITGVDRVLDIRADLGQHDHPVEWTAAERCDHTSTGSAWMPVFGPGFDPLSRRRPISARGQRGPDLDDRGEGNGRPSTFGAAADIGTSKT